MPRKPRFNLANQVRVLGADSLLPTKPNKFHAKKKVCGGITFASHAEASRYDELMLLQKGNVIAGLVLQPRFDMVVNGHLVGRYTPDFSYHENGKYVVEDVKSKATKTEAYGLRIKVFKATHPNIDFREITK